MTLGGFLKSGSHLITIVKEVNFSFILTTFSFYSIVLMPPDHCLDRIHWWEPGHERWSLWFYITCTDKTLEDETETGVNKNLPSPSCWFLVYQFNSQPCTTNAWRRDFLGELFSAGNNRIAKRNVCKDCSFANKIDLPPSNENSRSGTQRLVPILFTVTTKTHANNRKTPLHTGRQLSSDWSHKTVGFVQTGKICDLNLCRFL